MKKLLFGMMCFVTLLATTCVAQETSDDLQLTFTNWGGVVRGARLGIVLTNRIVSVDSGFRIFIRMENVSSNVIFVGESSLGGNYAVALKDVSGKVYNLTRTPRIYSYNMLLPINPGESRYWVKVVGIGEYYDQPGLQVTKTRVPSGDYTLEVTRTFLPTTNAKPVLIAANVMSIEIK